MSESGPEPGAADDNRRFDRRSVVPPSDAGEPDEDQRSTTALPRPAEPPRAQQPYDTRYDSPAARPTTALPRTTPPPGTAPLRPGFVSGYPDPAVQSPPRPTPPTPSAHPGGYAPEQPNTRRGSYTGATPSGAADRGFQRLEPRVGQGPVGPSWAPQHPYDAASARRADRGYSADRGHSDERGHPDQGGHPGDPADRRRRDQPVPDPYQPPDYPPRQDHPPRYPAARDLPGDQAARYRVDRDQDREYPPRDPPPRDHAERDHPPRDHAERDYPPRAYAERDHPADHAGQDDRDRHPGRAGERDGYDQPPTRRPPPRGSHLPPYSEPLSTATAGEAEAGPPSGRRSPRKLTVTRVAAFRSRELTHRGVELFHRATTADGADKSGLTSLTYAVMANYAVDAALAVALAGTLFFAAATAESTGRVLLYLVITVAPFAVIAPFIGPMLDRLQSGRRLALSVSSFGRALLALLMAFNFSNFNPWVIYPCALGNLVLSKAFGVLKAALTPRVLPVKITLVKTNSRLTTFGMIAGGVAGAVAAGLSKVTGSPGALFFTAVCAVAGGVLCLRIPAWVESTEGEVPVKEVGSDSPTRGFPRIVRATLWANSVIRVETGFLALFIAFVVKSQYPSPQYSAFTQLLLLGVVGGAAGIGGFLGNTMGARLTLSAPETISIFALVSVLVSTVVAVLVPGLATAAIVGFVGSTASALAKVSLDSVIQHHLPEESRASAFGKSESVLQLGWVFGGVVGLLLGGVWTFGHDSVYAIGFGTVTVMLVVGLVQSYLVRSGRTMIPKLSPALRRRGNASRSVKKQGAAARQAPGGDTDRLARPGPAATAHLPAVEADRPRRRSRKAGDGR